MVEWGNKRAEAYWLANLPPGHKVPSEFDSVPVLERWIRDKYERKLFVHRDGPEAVKRERRSSRHSVGSDHERDVKPTHQKPASTPTRPVFSIADAFEDKSAPNSASKLVGRRAEPPSPLPHKPTFTDEPPARPPASKPAAKPVEDEFDLLNMNDTPAPKASPPKPDDDWEAFTGHTGFAPAPAPALAPAPVDDRAAIMSMYHPPAPAMGHGYGMPHYPHVTPAHHGHPPAHMPAAVPGYAHMPAYGTSPYPGMPMPAGPAFPGYPPPHAMMPPASSGHMLPGPGSYSAHPGAYPASMGSGFGAPHARPAMPAPPVADKFDFASGVMGSMSAPKTAPRPVMQPMNASHSHPRGHIGFF